MKPRILYITPRWPHGYPHGSQLRTLQIARALQRMGELRLCVLDLLKPDAESVAKTRLEFKIETVVGLESVAKRSRYRRLTEALDFRRMGLYGFTATSSAKEEISRKLSEYDLVWVYKLESANMLERWMWPRSVMDIDDIPSAYEQTISRTGSSLRARLTAAWKMFSWKRREKLLGERFNVLSVCSQADREYLNANVPVHVIPNGFEIPAVVHQRKPADQPRLGFIGLLDYEPNCDGIQWFARECWPLIKQELPEARLRLVGRGTDGPAKPRVLDIDGLGWVDNADAEAATWNGMIVPIRQGGGTRVKIAYGFAQRCPVVSTSLGAFGYEVKNGEELHLADTPEAFAAACVRVVRQSQDSNAMAERAYRKFLDNWTWEAIQPRIWAAAEECLRANGALQKARALA
jgi:glycosyltransferase involved in cell wall biosynthesis